MVSEESAVRDHAIGRRPFAATTPRLTRQQSGIDVIVDGRLVAR
jgi:hypothetical protein